MLEMSVDLYQSKQEDHHVIHTKVLHGHALYNLSYYNSAIFSYSGLKQSIFMISFAFGHKFTFYWFTIIWWMKTSIYDLRNVLLDSFEDNLETHRIWTTSW